MEGITRDIMINILSRLPLRYVIQCSGVSKSWFSIINDPAFRKLHFSLSEPESTMLMLIHRVMRGNVISISPLKHKGPELRVLDIPISHMVSSYSWNLVGTCDGLLCFTSQEEIIMVCNPITKEHVTLPKPTIGRSPESCEPVFGFGVDSLTKKYKVVRVLYSRSLQRHNHLNIPRYNQQNFHATAEIYTLGDADSWRVVQGLKFRPHGKAVYADGCLYWGIDHFRDRIISFDLGKEEFTPIPHPSFTGELSLVELGGCLSVVRLTSSTLLEVSVLKNPVEFDWEMKYIINIHVPRALDTGFSRILCVNEHDGVLLIWLRDSLLSYESRTFRRRDLKLSGLPTWLDWEICSGFRGSLASVTGCHGDGNSRQASISFVNDEDFYSQSTCSIAVVEQKEGGKCDKIVSCFLKNGMLSD